jgi:sirohydrochlorin cobaltochelatase
VSSHSGHIDQVRFLARAVDTLSAEMMHHLHESGIERAPASVRIGVAAALDDSPELARALADRALALTRTPNEQALFLIGHGPNTAEDHAFWMTDLRRVADTIRAWTPFRDVKIGLVRDDAPAAVRAEAVREIRETIALQHAATGRDVVVVPILISSGTITRGKLPADLVGLGIAYSGAPLLPHPAMARWIERRVKDRR